MTLAVKVALNPNSINQPIKISFLSSESAFNLDISKCLSFGMEVWSFEIHQGFFSYVGEWPQGQQVGKKFVNIGKNLFKLLSDI